MPIQFVLECQELNEKNPLLSPSEFCCLRCWEENAMQLFDWWFSYEFTDGRLSNEILISTDSKIDQSYLPSKWVDFLISNFLTSSACCGQRDHKLINQLMQLVNLFVHLTMEAVSNVPAGKEDIVSQFLYAPFSKLTFNDKLELFGKGRPTPELNLCRKMDFVFK